MADRLDELVLAITGDVSGLGEATAAAQQQLGGLGKATQNVANQSSASAQQWTMDWGKVGANMSAIGKSATVGLTMPLAAAGVAAVNLASDMDETLNKVGVTFGENASAVEAWSSTSIESMGLAQQSAMDTAALYGDMGAGMGIAGEQGYYMATSLVQLSADMASFKNVSQERAATALAGIYTGETEALKGLGVVMTQANLQQFAATQGITKNISEMSQAEQVTLRYQYVMAQTSNAQGDFARTGGGMANQSRMVKEQLKQLGVNIGQQLLPAATKLVQWANNMLAGWNKLDPGTRKIIVAVGAMAAAVGPVVSVGGKMVTTYNNVKKALDGTNVGPYIAGLLGVTQAQTQSSMAANVSASAQEKQAEAASEAASAQTGLAGSASAAAVSQTSAGVAAGAAAAGETTAGAAAAGATPAVGALGVAFNSLLGPVGLVIGVLGAVGVGAYNLMNSTDDAAESMDGLADSASGAAEVMGQYDTAMQATSTETLAAAESVNSIQAAVDAISFEPAALELSEFAQSAVDSAAQMVGEVTRHMSLLSVNSSVITQEARETFAKNVKGMSDAGILAIANYTTDTLDRLAQWAIDMGLVDSEAYTGMYNNVLAWGDAQSAAYMDVTQRIQDIMSGARDAEFASEAEKHAALISAREEANAILLQQTQDASDAQSALYTELAATSIQLTAEETATRLTEAERRKQAVIDEAETVRQESNNMAYAMMDAGQITYTEYQEMIAASNEHARATKQHAQDAYTFTVNQIKALSQDSISKYDAHYAALENVDTASAERRAAISQGYNDKITRLQAELETASKNATVGGSLERLALEQELKDELARVEQEKNDALAKEEELHQQEIAQIQGDGNQDYLQLMDLFGDQLLYKAQDNTAQASDAAIERFGQGRAKMYSAGEDYVDGAVQGIDNNAYRAEAAGRRLGNRVNVGMRSTLQLGSPSRLARKYLSWYVDGGVQGVDAEGPKLVQAVAGIVGDVNGQTARLGRLGMSLPAMPASPQPTAIGNLPSTGRAETVMVVDGQVFGRLVTGYADAGLDNIAANTDRLGVYIR